ncbi:hypothetical protein T265_11223 [Opisthorchis viverrini]|uniref:Uncharacterized protein n=1 Tax=Opisthorchis viverrini TaxID=6198 RepID=A0A074ZYE3_OPIVI|nr:hypothetical protein T265_11223 [Opisthorchis viverrini]KER20159.1 hypothetical protein T265_11223 [Opisthorchis viverrini]
MLELRIIHTSSSHWSSPLYMVPDKSEGRNLQAQEPCEEDRLLVFLYKATIPVPRLIKGLIVHHSQTRSSGEKDENFSWVPENIGQFIIANIESESCWAWKPDKLDIQPTGMRWVNQITGYTNWYR